jgi:PleD family two-component response regulator
VGRRCRRIRNALNVSRLPRRPATRGWPLPSALIIDDKDSICCLVATILAELGVESANYLAAKPAIASLDQRRPEIIFLDVPLEQADATDGNAPDQARSA